MPLYKKYFVKKKSTPTSSQNSINSHSTQKSFISLSQYQDSGYETTSNDIENKADDFNLNSSISLEIFNEVKSPNLPEQIKEKEKAILPKESASFSNRKDGSKEVLEDKTDITDSYVKDMNKMSEKYCPLDDFLLNKEVNEKFMEVKLEEREPNLKEKLHELENTSEKRYNLRKSPQNCLDFSRSFIIEKKYLPKTSPKKKYLKKKTSMKKLPMEKISRAKSPTKLLPLKTSSTLSKYNINSSIISKPQENRCLLPHNQKYSFHKYLNKIDSFQLLQKSHDVGLYVLCDSCKKWRYLKDTKDPLDLPNNWYCFMNPHSYLNNCNVPDEPIPPSIEDELVKNDYNAGSIVWVKIKGMPWWPAMVDDDPETELFVWLDTSEVPIEYNVTLFNIALRAWVHKSKIVPFVENNPNELKKFYGGPNKCRNTYIIAEKEAKSALNLSLIKRLEKFSFFNRYLKDSNFDIKEVKKTDLKTFMEDYN